MAAAFLARKWVFAITYGSLDNTPPIYQLDLDVKNGVLVCVIDCCLALFYLVTHFHRVAHCIDYNY